MKVEDLEKKDFIVTIKWRVDASDHAENGMEEELGVLNERGYAVVEDIELVDKEES